MSVLVIDWLGRGGIAQTAAAWALELDGAGRRVQVLSRVGLELGASGSITVVGAGRGRGPIFTHARVVRRAVEVVRSERPEVVVVHNYLIPMMERPVFRAIREVGSRLVMVVHDHHPHSRLAGTTAGLRAALRQADLVVAHSRFVADGVREFAQVDAEVIPHPIIIETLAHPAEEAPQELLGPGSLALHFGVLKRRYKGLSVVTELAKRRPMGWRIGVVGTGAPPHLEGAVTIPGFLPPATLVACVRASAVTVLPYRFATQSGAVALAQVLGSVPIVSGIGGLREQVEHERTGLLLPAGAGISAWLDALHRLEDRQRRLEMSDLAQRRRLDDHRRFRAGILDITGTQAPPERLSAEETRVERLVAASAGG